MSRWNKTTASYGCFHIDCEHLRTKNANVFFLSSPTNLFSFAKGKHGPSNKIWSLHHVARATAVTQKVDAVALRAQKTALSYECKNTEVEAFFHKRKEWMLSSCYCWYLRTDYSHMFFIQNNISINSPLNYVIWRAPSIIFHERECLWVRARSL